MLSIIKLLLKFYTLAIKWVNFREKKKVWHNLSIYIYKQLAFCNTKWKSVMGLPSILNKTLKEAKKWHQASLSVQEQKSISNYYSWRARDSCNDNFLV